MEPTGALHEVAIDELFFSTTDSRGVIEQANSVFVRLSGYSREELVDAPHNVIRHPRMPGGAFKLMWDTLQSGRPFGAYVSNLAKTGSQYDVFATITPLGSGYLSVRSRPMVAATKAVVESLYESTLAKENDLRQQGYSRVDVAAEGAAHLAGLVQSAGFSSYDEFLWGALPAEVEAREAEFSGLPRWPRLGGPLRDMLEATTWVHSGLESRMARLTDLGELSTQLAKAVSDLDTTTVESLKTADAISNVLGENPGWGPLMMPLQLWRDMGASLSEDLIVLRSSLEELRASSAQTRFRISLSRLHATATALFINELITDEPGSDQALPSIHLLHRALSDGVDDMSAQAHHHAELANMVSKRIDDAAGLLQIPLAVMNGWREMAEARQIPESISSLVPKVEVQLASSQAAVEALRELAGQARQSAQGEDVTDLRQGLSTLQEVAQGVAF